MPHVRALSSAAPGAAPVEEEAAANSFSIAGSALEGRPAYLDFQATTPMDPRVLDAMLPYMTEGFGNPHSRTHEYGWTAEAAVEKVKRYMCAVVAVWG